MKKLILLISTIFFFVNVNAQDPFVNEIHYDNTGGDVGEFFEVCVPTGFVGNLADYTLSTYNGSNCSVSGSLTLDMFVVGATDATCTYITWNPSSIQNGSPDGWSIDNLGTVTEWLTYEGTCAATDGPANGTTSTDIGAAEDGTEATGLSLQLVGGIWVGPTGETPGATNASGTLGCTDIAACNFDVAATIDDGSCLIAGAVCDDGDPATIGETIQADCSCGGGTTGLASCGVPTWETVSVTDNSDGDVWTPITNPDGFSMNGFCGGGCSEQVDQWLVYGPLDMSAVSTLQLVFDALEAFGTTDLNVYYTDDYSSACPNSTTWTNAATITAAGAQNVDLSAAAGTMVYIAIEYSDDGADGYSGWDLTNFDLIADACPVVGTAIVSDCSGTPPVFDCPTEMVNFGDTCDDMDATTTNDVVQMDCTCAGTIPMFDCPTEMVNFGDTCDDGDMATTGDVIQSDCSCAGSPTGGGNCPASAKINEFHYDNIGGDANTFVEIALPAGSDPTQIQVDLYNGSNGTTYDSVILSAAEFVSTDGTLDYYVWNPGSIQNGGPDGIATSCIDGTQFMFLSYEGAFMATDGPLSGVMSTDVGVEEDGGTTTDAQSIMCDGTGTYLTNCTSDAGFANDLTTCGTVVTEDCPGLGNFGDSCDDGNAATTGDTIQSDCSCSGTDQSDCEADFGTFPGQ